MTGDKSAPQQHKQTSRKGKRAWRKNVDISDVQDGLEHLREEIITGGPIAEKPSGDIFAIDTQGCETVRKDYQKKHKPLKADEILAHRSVIPAMNGRKRSNSKIGDGILHPSSKRQKKDWVPRQEVERLRRSLNETNHLSIERLESGQDVTFDLWTASKAAKDDELDYLEKPRPKVAPVTVSHAPIPMTENGKPVKAIQAPKAGTSYNPSFTDWDDLLNEEGQKAVETEKKRLQAEQFEAERAERIAAIASADAAGGPTDDESAWEGFESEYDGPHLLGKKRPERKTLVQRNKIKRRKEAEQQALHQAKMADRRKQGRELEQLGRHWRGKSEVSGQVAVADGWHSSSDGDDSSLRRKRLRNVSIPDKSLEVVLPDELQESLRRLKPEGSLLQDRFRHLLVNGKVEARKAVVQPKKKRVTYTEKWTYKDFQIAV